jgi:UDP-N-acetylmuramate--alanine ligase
MLKKKPTLAEARRLYFIGIKGAGMASLAEVMVKKGRAVFGSDTSEVFFTDEVLKQAGIAVRQPFAIANIPDDIHMVIYSTAYTSENNAELKYTRAIRLSELSYPEALGELMKDYLGLAVCGTHGKTTTTAMLAEVLRFAGEDPLAIVGSKILQCGGNAFSGKGKYFVFEADEYQNKLQYYHPFGAILTSVDWDHPDFFPTAEEYRKVFVDFVEKIPAHGVLVSCGDNTSVVEVARKAHSHILSYGFLEGNDARIVEYTPTENFTQASNGDASIKQSFEIVYQGNSLGVFVLQLAGKHNAHNAAAVITLCAYLKIDIEKVREALRLFQGTARRFEYIGEANNGALVYDDYAHHPEEIKATIKAFRDLYPTKRLIAVFHPHTFTRTKAFLDDFAQSFDDADMVFVLDIYGSTREVQGGVTSADLVQRINTYTSGKAQASETIATVSEELHRIVQPDVVVVTLGAGNVWEVAHILVSHKES